jgi:hypothetical protein
MAGRGLVGPAVVGSGKVWHGMVWLFLKGDDMSYRNLILDIALDRLEILFAARGCTPETVTRAELVEAVMKVAIVVAAAHENAADSPSAAQTLHERYTSPEWRQMQDYVEQHADQCPDLSPIDVEQPL